MIRHPIRHLFWAISTTVGGLAIGYLIYLVFSLNSTALSTVCVSTATVETGIYVDGLLVRDESLVLKTRGQFVAVTAEDCSKVALGEELALVFPDKENYDNYQAAQAIRAEYAAMASIAASDGDITVSEINSCIRSIVNAAANNGNFGLMSSVKQDLIYSVLSRSYVLGDKTQFDTILKSIAEDMKAADASFRSSGCICAPDSGCFVTTIDGWEQIASFSQIEDISYEEYQQLIEAGNIEPDLERTVGKIISGWDWYYLFTVEPGYVAEIDEGDTLTITLAEETFTFELVSRQPAEDGSSVLFVCSCDRMLLDLVSYRQISGLLITSQLQGFRLPVEAIHVVDGVTGVYVVEGATVRFKPVTVLSVDAQYYLLKVSTTDTDALFINDEVIVSGKNIYDGKILK